MGEKRKRRNRRLVPRRLCRAAALLSRPATRNSTALHG